MDLKKLIAKPLSDIEIKNALDGKVNIVKYTDLKNMTNIKQLLGQFGRAIILFETKHNEGHWCSLIFSPKHNCLIFTDSYGLYPERELDYVPKVFLNMSDQKRNYLFKLLYDQPLEIRYSQYRLQKLKRGVNTCGRYSILRCAMPDLNEDEYANLLRSSKYNPDELVTLATSNV